MRKLIAAVLGIGMLLALSLGIIAPAQAHTGGGSADCNAVYLHAQSYDAGAANTYSISLDGVVQQSGTFGAGGDWQSSVPQDYKVHTWATKIQAENGDYLFEDSGTVGPCGTPPPPTCADTPSLCPPPTHIKRAWIHVTPYCNKVRVEGKHGVESIEKTRNGNHYTFKAHAKKGYLFKNGKKTVVRHAHTKKTGCGNVSGY